MACGIFIALTQAKLHAQTQQEEHNARFSHYNDTLFIKLLEGNKVIITGAQFRKLKDYSQADSLKSLFLNDYDRAIADKTLPADASIIHYFAHSSGKRRIKAETAEYSDNKVDVAYEVTRLNLDLPKYQYYIHDLTRGYTILVYMNDPDKLKSALSTISLNEAIVTATKDKELCRQNAKIELTQDNSSYKVTGKQDKGLDMIVINPSLGVTVLGNTIAPIIGADMALLLNDKYSTGKYKIGLGYSVFPLAKMTDLSIADVNYVRSLQVNFMTNLNMHTELWFGLTGGFMKSDIISYNKVFKAGLIFESKVTYSFDIIFDRNDNRIAALTVKLPF